MEFMTPTYQIHNYLCSGNQFQVFSVIKTSQKYASVVSRTGIRFFDQKMSPTPVA